MTLPSNIQVNAWANKAVVGPTDATLKSRIIGRAVPDHNIYLPVLRSPETDWFKPDVGWGLVLPDNLEIEPAQRATSVDAPEPIQRLHAARGGPVFRITRDWAPGKLGQYTEDGTFIEPIIAAGNIGTAPGHIPKYLLIAGSPEQIPWRVQYDLQVPFFTGRLDLDENGLRNYVNALLSDWDGMAPNKANTLVWSVDHGKSDITHWLRRAIGKPLHAKFANETDEALNFGAHYLQRSCATHGALTNAIRVRRPSLIATTSHAETWPLDDPSTMRSNLGLLIDADKTRLDLSDLVENAAPAGAIWYAHACCSAGATETSAYIDVLQEGTTAHDVVSAVTSCGEVMSPLPRALLGAPGPLAGFIGQVEPTFDWTIKHPETGQYLSKAILDCLYQALFTGCPVGMALEHMRNVLAQVGNSRSIAEEAFRDHPDPSQLGYLLSLTLSAHDWRSVVLLGDPTVTL